ncbi:BA75_04003T0 [Komagataella pastoris]|uniref:BA75_04003T0 n=1 Tax=Komagataella pastoris TaxID=4922 RepID=A0A1B2JF42_PICPA|nr:BA75_04003T0 [Komagataella pastoris]
MIDKETNTPQKPFRSSRFVNSSPVGPSGSSLEQMEQRMNSRNQKIFRPMSSPIRKAYSLVASPRSPTKRAHYVSTRLQKKRQEKAVQNRGGLEQMEEFVMKNEYYQYVEELENQARLNSIDPEMLEFDPNDDQALQLQQQELEEMIRLEQEELEALAATFENNLNLNSQAE